MQSHWHLQIQTPIYWQQVFIPRFCFVTLNNPYIYFPEKNCTFMGTLMDPTKKTACKLSRLQKAIKFTWKLWLLLICDILSKQKCMMEQEQIQEEKYIHMKEAMKIVYVLLPIVIYAREWWSCCPIIAKSKHQDNFIDETLLNTRMVFNYCKLQ